VLRVEVKSAVALASARGEAKDLTRKIVLLKGELAEVRQAWDTIGPPRVRSHMSEGMWITALRHTEMEEELAALRAAVSSVAEFTLGRSPNEAFRVKVVDELIAEFWKSEERRSRLERPGTRVCDLILGPPSDKARLANRLEEATEQLGAK
jgi:hypothetical protein